MKRIFILTFCCLCFGLFSLSKSQDKVNRGTMKYEVVQRKSATIPIKGRVIDTETLLPLRGASVSILGTPLGASSIEHGEYTLLAPSGSHSLRVKYSGYKTEEKTITVGENRDLVLNFALQREEVQQDPRNEKDIYFVAVEDLPEPVGGIIGIQGKVVYPEIARRAGIEGTVFVEVFIDEAGNVVQTFIVKGIGAGCDEAAIKAIQETKFIPGRQQGKPVKVRMAVPIRFRLGKQGAELNANVEKRSTLKVPTVFIAAGPMGLKRHISYPDEAVRNNVEGVVYIDARLNPEKKTVGVNLKQGLAFGIDYDVMRAVAAYKFFEDQEIPKPQADTTISIVIQFLLPKK